MKRCLKRGILEKINSGNAIFRKEKPEEKLEETGLEEVSAGGVLR